MRFLTLSFNVALFIFACDHSKLVQSQIAPNLPPEKQAPVLIHTGANLKVYAWTAVWESVYVANAIPGEWEISLLSAPPGTILEKERLLYMLPDGLSGLQMINVQAVKDTFTLRAT